MNILWLRKAGIVLCLVLLSIELFISFQAFGLAVVDSFVYHTFIGEFLRIFLTPITCTLAISGTIAFVLIYRKRNDFAPFLTAWVTLLFLCFLMAYVLAMVFGMSKWWFMKYTLGIFVGIMAYAFNKNRINTRTTFLTGFTALATLSLCEWVEYVRGMDPSPFPSTLYIGSFPNFFVWFAFILLTIVPAIVLASGFPFRWVKDSRN